VLGVIFSLLAAVSFGINNATVRRGVITGTVTQVVVVSMPIGLAMFLIVAAASGQLFEIGRFSPASALLLASAGVIHFVIGRYCGYRSIQAMGANLASPVQQWSLLVTLTLAVVFLRETLDILKIFGIALMVLGPAMIVSARSGRKARSVPPAATSAAPAAAPKKFTPRLAEGYFFGILCCLCWGSSPILVRAGLDGTGLALAGGVISYTAACLAVAVILLLPRARRDYAGIKRGNVIWFVWIGVTVCISQIFMYLAMAIAPVTVVQPLMRFASVFATLFSWILNRDYEIFDAGVLSAIGVSMLGAVALSLDAGMLVRWLDAPPWLATAALWSWPAR
jgi:drug/metabolite transporter (DMT)-like permease